MAGQIKVTVQREDRLQAIIKLSSAIESLARALHGTMKVEIRDCCVTANGTGISIDTEDVVTETLITEIDSNVIEQGD